MVAPRAGLEHLFQHLRHRHICLLVHFLTSFSVRVVSSWVKAGRKASLNTPFHKSSPLSLRPGLLTTEDRSGRPSLMTIRLGAFRPLLWNLLSPVWWWQEGGMRLANVRRSPLLVPASAKAVHLYTQSCDLIKPSSPISCNKWTPTFTDMKWPVPLVTEAE